MPIQLNNVRQDQSCLAISPTVSAERPYPLRVVVGFRLRQRGYGGVLVASQEKESRNE
jgi:hypothetical protein